MKIHPSDGPYLVAMTQLPIWVHATDQKFGIAVRLFPGRDVLFDFADL